MTELEATLEFFAECPLGIFTDSEGGKWVVNLDHTHTGEFSVWLEKHV